MNENLENEKLATGVASLSAPPPETTSQEYQRLNDLALDGAKKVVNRCESLTKAWAELMPTLNAMQALLSERGVDRESQFPGKQPTWTTWLNDYLKKTGLEVSVRTVQRHLATFRGLGKRQTEPSDPPLKLSARDQRRLLKAAQCGNELIEALEAGVDFQPLVQEYKEIAIGTEKIDQLLNVIPTEPAPPIKPLALPPKQGPENAIGLAAPATSGPVTTPSTWPFMPKAGDGSGLASYICDRCDEALKGVLDGLDADPAAECLRKVVHQLAGRYCTYDRRNGQIKVIIDYVAADGLLEKQAA